MLRLRLFLVWLVMAALPLQGWAAATMLYCGPAQKSAAHAKAHAQQAASHHDDMQAAHHDVQSAHAQHHVDAADAAASEGAQPVADSPHTCGVCATCCHGVALAQTPQWPSITAAPGADLVEPLFFVLARPSPVPDKPPRA
ncbi:MAG: hypothetical protein K0Q43_4909 [Ramlibacter sp.]|jgi:hypothetical protein|nr:hypothetical protein [Ramlibacter sp.]